MIGLPRSTEKFNSEDRILGQNEAVLWLAIGENDELQKMPDADATDLRHLQLDDNSLVVIQ